MDLARLGWNPHFEQHFARFRDGSVIPARVDCEHARVYFVYCEYGELAAKVSGKLLHAARSKGELPAIGDWVVVRPHLREAKATILAVLPRTSTFSRKVAGAITEEQILAANVDKVFLVSSLDREFNLRRMERYLTLALDSGAEPVVVLNKADLCADIPWHVERVKRVAPGVPVYAVSAVCNEGLDTLREYTSSGQTVAFLGSSGVGKSSLINCLLGAERQQVGAVRESDGRGRHITSRRELVLLPGAGAVIDSPGMRELQMWTDEESLKASFDDIEELAARCRFRDCTHKHEPGCAVRQAIDAGALDEERLANYFRLKKEVHRLASRKEGKERLLRRALRRRRAGLEAEAGDND